MVRLESPQPHPVFQTAGHWVASCPLPVSPSFSFICLAGPHLASSPKLCGHQMPNLPCLILHSQSSGQSPKMFITSGCAQSFLWSLVRDRSPKLPGWGFLGLRWTGMHLFPVSHQRLACPSHSGVIAASDQAVRATLSGLKRCVITKVHQQGHGKQMCPYSVGTDIGADSLKDSRQCPAVFLNIHLWGFTWQVHPAWAQGHMHKDV